jgi:hypothetical protein
MHVILINAWQCANMNYSLYDSDLVTYFDNIEEIVVAERIDDA